jgi:hypothetical protein
MRRLSGWGAPMGRSDAGLGRRGAPMRRSEAGLGRRGAPMRRSEAGVGRRRAPMRRSEAGLGRLRAPMRRSDGALRCGVPRLVWAVAASWSRRTACVRCTLGPATHVTGGRTGQFSRRIEHLAHEAATERLDSRIDQDLRRRSVRLMHAEPAECLRGASGALGPAQEVSSWRRAFGSRRGLDRRSGSAAPGLSGRRRARQPPDSVAAGVGSTAARARQPPDSVAAGVGSTAARAQEPAGSATGVGSAAPGLSGRRPRLPCGGPR